MKNKNVEQEKKEKIDWHSYSVEDTFKKVESSTNGLSDEQARERLAKDGANTLPRKKPKSVFLMFIEELINPIVLILLVAMAFSFVVGEILDGCVILGIVSIDAIMGTVQSKRAQRIAGSLSGMIKVKAKVLRDGSKIEIESKELRYGFLIRSGAILINYAMDICSKGGKYKEKRRGSHD